MLEPEEHQKKMSRGEKHYKMHECIQGGQNQTIKHVREKGGHIKMRRDRTHKWDECHVEAKSVAFTWKKKVAGKEEGESMKEIFQFLIPSC